MVRYFKEQDKTAFLEMADRFYHMPAVLHSVDQSYFERTFDAIISGTPYAAGMLAEYEGKPAGYALLSLTWSNEAGGLVVWIEEAYVEAQFRSCGIGKELFAFIRREFDGKARRYRLEVTKDNLRAIKLYEALGYQPLDYRQMVLDLENE
ncbi:GNAT family N-acetyltransferase [Massiliimalia massiliensis]|mgnify:CR=1 FL=1|jgi:GNAT superfamily N-acetyltransferase|uniref:GNAT family N-acetyltransferase n=1 Tax=Massiliimalia massiliensis TaxID=1852384 RepID=UPI000986C165|nr:GNAT family N-acetyltransferase [Massiliimalia massiliensis]